MTTTTITFERKVREHREVEIGSCWMNTSVNEFSKSKKTTLVKILSKDDVSKIKRT